MPNNENKQDELIQILEQYNKYVPVVNGEAQQICFAGDQLTAARARQAQQIRVNSSDRASALRGIVPFACDWHTKVNFISVSFCTVLIKF